MATKHYIVFFLVLATSIVLSPARHAIGMPQVFADPLPADTLSPAQSDTLTGTGTALTVPDSTALQAEDGQSSADTSMTTEDDQGDTQTQADRDRNVLPAVTEIISFTKIFSSMLVLLLIWGFIRFLSAALTNLSERFSGQRLLIKRIIPVSKVVLWAAALYFVIAGIIQPPVETIITVSASVGIAIGFASQDILRNIFGGIMIILDRPFQVGDKIDIDGQYGEVLQIGLRSVRIVTEDDSVVTVPNAEIMNKAVSNANSSALDCQVVAELFLPRNTDSDVITAVCRRAAQTSRYVYLNKPVFVHITHTTVGPRDYLKVRVKAYVLDIRYEQEFRSDMTVISMRELRRLGLSEPG